jgi:hypothetical protein
VTRDRKAGITENEARRQSRPKTIFSRRSKMRAEKRRNRLDNRMASNLPSLWYNDRRAYPFWHVSSKVLLGPLLYRFASASPLVIRFSFCPLLSRSELHQRSLAKREAGITEGLAKRARESPEVKRSELLAPRVRETFGDSLLTRLSPKVKRRYRFALLAEREAIPSVTSERHLC